MWSYYFGLRRNELPGALILCAAILAAPAQGKSAETVLRSATCSGTADNPYAVVHPNGGQTFHVGDSITLEFCTAEPSEYPIAEERRPVIWFSVDNGQEYHILIESISEARVTWIIPDTIIGYGNIKISTVSNTCKIRIQDYILNEVTDDSDKPFKILGKANSIGRWLNSSPTTNKGVAYQRVWPGYNVLGQSMGMRRQARVIAVFP